MLNQHSVFLLKDGTVRTVGYNQYAQCGNGSVTVSPYALTALFQPNISNVRQVACGDSHTIFLLNDGTVRTVGNNINGQCAVGSATPATQLSLYNPGLTGVKQVAAGSNYTIFLLNDGTVRTVGLNSSGQCGTGNTTSPQLTLYNPGLTNVKQIACGASHTAFLLNDGTVRTIGSNGYGQCANGTTNTQLLTPYNPGLTNVKQIECGQNYTIFLLKDGTVKTVGFNVNGQCGTGTITSPQLTLFTIPGLTDVKQIACGGSHSVFLLNDGTVRTVGYNQYGQCGTVNATTPQLTLYNPGLTNVTQLTCGSGHTSFLLNDGTVKTVGLNTYSQCGTGNTATPQLSLYKISSLNNVNSLWDYVLQTIIYLIKQYNNYYSIKPAYYDINNFVPLTLTGGSIPNASDIESFGFDNMNDLISQITINSETFKPIDKLSNVFEIKQYTHK